MSEKKINWKTLKLRLSDRVAKDGHAVKNLLANDLEFLIEHQGWSQFLDIETEKPFASIADFLLAAFPAGVGCGQNRNNLTYEDVMTLCHDRPIIYDLMAKHAPNRGRGRPKKMEENCSARSINRGHAKANTSNVLSARLAQEKPKFYEAFRRGEYRSIRAAAEAAGLVKPGHDPLMRCKAYYKKLDAKQRKKFLAWVETLE
jgi:hypothetical protein